MTTKKSKKGLVKGKAEMIKEVFEFFQFSMPPMPPMPPMPTMPDRMPPPISGSDNVPNLQEHLRKKNRKRS